VAGATRRLTFDIFCAVVDNYGDIGVCWRLARQLAGEYGLAVRLWLDDPASLARIAPSTDLPDIEVRCWDKDFPSIEPADVVIEAFACELPPPYVAAMAARERKPVWINLEYLSAESWVAGCHLGESRHPSLALTKYFFFPGFTPDTGGLLCERGLYQACANFHGEAVTQFWSRLALPPAAPDECRVSLFGYDNTALEGLLQTWADGLQPVTCLVPQGPLAERARRFVGQGRGRLRLQEFRFLPQEEYDRLLWACDCNFVRGEDSFVRAQWAGKPFVWHIYPQQEGAHGPKLEAFLDLYCAGLAPDVEAGLRAFWQAWNRGDAADWNGFWRYRAELQQHTHGWVARLKAQTDLASNMVKLCKNKV
jgi:uncharacterized repeat protein (TIGR03837 family)